MALGMWSPKNGETWLLGFAVAATRFVCRSRVLYDLDSVNFGLALQHFDPRVHQPHPPGYFLYIGLGRLLQFIVRDANLALVVLSIVASCGAAVVIYHMADEWFGRDAARFAGLLFLFSPLGWFHGTVALTYAVEAFFSALIAYWCWKLASGRMAMTEPVAILLGIAAGVRPSSLMLLGPLYLFSLRGVPLTRAARGLVVLAATLAAWFGPMIWMSGGIARYLGALISLWRLVPGRDTVFNSSPGTSIARAATVAFIFVMTFGLAGVASIRLLRAGYVPDERKRWFTVVWVLPALCFYTFIFLKFMNSGYLLILIAPGCLWLGSSAADWFRSSMWPRHLRIAVVALCAIGNTYLYTASPFYCSYRSVRRFESELAEITQEIPRIGQPGDTLIVGFDSHFLGYRHAGYYLPGYDTVEFPGVVIGEGYRIFAMRDGQTTLSGGLPPGNWRQFVFFPLPAGDGKYADYLAGVEKKVPTGGLRTVHIARFDYVTGPISDLQVMFPAAGAPAAGVYPPLHPAAQAVNSSEHYESSIP